MAFNLFGISIPQISLPSLPKIEVPKIKIPEPPKIEIPKITVPDIPKVIPKIVTSPVPVAAVAGAVGEAAAGAVVGWMPKVELPRISLPEPQKELPSLDAGVPRLGGSGAGDGDRPATSASASTTGGAAGRLPGFVLPAFGGVSKPGTVGLEPPPGGNIIDTVIGARDKSYEVGLEQAFSGNVAGGGAQFAATAAADVLLPMDLMDAGNLWMTGRGDQIDGELALWAAIDAVTLAAAPFTFGASYAAGRALKAGKVAAKTAKIGGEMGKTTAITKLVTGLSGAGKTTGAVKPAVKVPTTAVRSTADITTAMRKQAGAAKSAYAKQIAEMQKTVTKAVSGLKPASAAKTSTALGKTGTALKYTGLGLGTGAIGLTALGALGAPAPQEIPEGGDGGGGALGGGDQVTGAGDGWWTEFMNSLYGGGAYDPSLYEGYDPYAGYYDPGYPDPLGVEPYAQDLLSYAEEVPVVGGVATAAKQSGFALPLIVGAVVLVILVVALLRSKKGKAMISGAKKTVSGAVSAGKKAVGA